ncbi:hypothetical protein MYCTH_89426 [Thermothelomyces thermophilus ATCC 42464]|uniref:Protein kinase domain-containing protein n=1 Tax=Thermothelomyces thermophilus (strain ATCC 42464 / BCRC 31852 / DSM 1799) TaxID=573729 RepID=G2Q6J6_THET4|nr:uncharacterized protein MYCTH_89426 [Thermothelomyces thermophilus ATCC 42464]AEO55569.1 hypothetical protein MYCTH_89426 [Thermothelomyces thermophilus ATCC 42464]
MMSTAHTGRELNQSHPPRSFNYYLVDGPIEEATLPTYRRELFHPTHPDQILNSKYRIVSKLGYGAYSTVWLAENLSWRENEPTEPRYVTVKIGVRDLETVKEEKALCDHIATAAPESGFASLLRLPIDSFDLEGPDGSHPCLVYLPMRESLDTFQEHEFGREVTPVLTKLLAARLLGAVHYLHEACGVIHTDIKEENILLSVEDPAVLDDFVREKQKQGPQPRHVSPDGRATYVSHPHLGPFRSLKFTCQLSDFDRTYPLKPGKAYLHPLVQPHTYRAPEVLLGAGWSAPIDMWNIGLVVWKMMQGSDLFERDYMCDKDGNYSAQAHLAQIISYFGLPPKELIERERANRHIEARNPIINPQGKPCKTVAEFWGGPFFDDSGEFIRKDLIRPGLSLEGSLTYPLEDEERALFLDLISSMLKWIPEERATAGNLLDHPYFASVMDSKSGQEELENNE